MPNIRLHIASRVSDDFAENSGSMETWQSEASQLREVKQYKALCASLFFDRQIEFLQPLQHQGASIDLLPYWS